MEAIKQTRIKRNGNQLIVTLPDTFIAEEADLLIWPSANAASSVMNLSEDLLQWPEMSDDKLLLINDKRKHLNKWK